MTETMKISRFWRETLRAIPVSVSKFYVKHLCSDAAKLGASVTVFVIVHITKFGIKGRNNLKMKSGLTLLEQPIYYVAMR